LGTTGDPKGVVLTPHGVLDGADTFAGSALSVSLITAMSADRGDPAPRRGAHGFQSEIGERVEDRSPAASLLS
jgi:hypothetical protein